VTSKGWRFPCLSEKEHREQYDQNTKGRGFRKALKNGVQPVAEPPLKGVPFLASVINPMRLSVKPFRLISLTLVLMLSCSTLASAELLALLNYESQQGQPPDERYLFVQNSLLNLEGMSDGSITVIDLTKGGKVVGSIDTLKAQGFNPNCIMLLPNHFQPSGLRAGSISQ